MRRGKKKYILQKTGKALGWLLTRPKRAWELVLTALSLSLRLHEMALLQLFLIPTSVCAVHPVSLGSSISISLLYLGVLFHFATGHSQHLFLCQWLPSSSIGLSCLAFSQTETPRFTMNSHTSSLGMYHKHNKPTFPTGYTKMLILSLFLQWNVLELHTVLQVASPCRLTASWHEFPYFW